MAIDWNKPVETDELNPRPVRVLATDMGGSHPVAVAYLGNPPTLANYTDCGQGWSADISAKYLKPLRNVQPKQVKREGWMFVGKTEAAIRMNTYVYASEDIARERHPGGCPGYQLIRIEWEEVP